MSVNHDFSRRFFADFIASRLKAWSLGEGGSRPTSRARSLVDHRNATRVGTDAGETPAIDEGRGVIPGLGASGT